MKQFDCSVFNGEYVAGGIDEDYLQALQQKRSDKAKNKKIRCTSRGRYPR